MLRELEVNPVLLHTDTIKQTDVEDCVRIDAGHVPH